MSDHRTMIRGILIVITSFMLVLSTCLNYGCTRQPSTEEVLNSLVDWVSETRRLEKPSYLEYEFITEAELRQKLLDDFDNANTREELAINQELLSLLGLIGSDVDLYNVLLELYTEQIAGYYNNEDKKLYVISSESTLSARDKVTFVHEVTHALQDHHYDMKSLQDEAGDDTEYSVALTALMEGDALISEIMYIQNLSDPEYRELERQYEEIESPKFNAAPPYIQQSILFPYSYGLDFVIQLFNNSNYTWTLIDDAYVTHPKSTEQIIHIDKYIGEDDPIEVELPDFESLLGGSWQLEDNGTVGEFDTMMTLESFIEPSEQTADAAAGWGGDQYVYLKNDEEEETLVIYYAWDTQSDAHEFFDLYAVNKAGTDINNNTWVLSTNQANQKTWISNDTVTHLEISENNVILIVAPDTAIANQVRNAVLN